ncbi:unnamed protein product [Symbiodinium sp. CCMP2592]|nr:unnamed protein product [Symbiodinium sp. CCMP2592]
MAELRGAKLARPLQEKATAAGINLENSACSHKHVNGEDTSRYETKHAEGGFRSVLVCSGSNDAGIPYSWSGKEFEGEISKAGKQAEQFAAKKFLNDIGVQETARGVLPANRYIQELSFRKKVRKATLESSHE